VTARDCDSSRSDQGLQHTNTGRTRTYPIPPVRGKHSERGYVHLELPITLRAHIMRRSHVTQSPEAKIMDEHAVCVFEGNEG